MCDKCSEIDRKIAHFKDLAVRFEMDPLQDFFPRERVIATYEEL